MCLALERSAEMKKGQHSGAQEASGELYVVVELAGIEGEDRELIVLFFPAMAA